MQSSADASMGISLAGVRVQLIFPSCWQGLTGLSATSISSSLLDSAWIPFLQVLHIQFDPHVLYSLGFIPVHFLWNSFPQRLHFSFCTFLAILILQVLQSFSDLFVTNDDVDGSGFSHCTGPGFSSMSPANNIKSRR